ncbi:unnamed protein product [Spirodela intermedia]|uniref:Uncharacterized protein n=1 Tax=Spirodela intermedia TaxID=51605 RepID=A0A7I8I9J3_SPIIN|nr:unnamed protein product [Spirodela intermedia]CAA6653732.1 unnamed protein product [Spirodela intermedia]
MAVDGATGGVSGMADSLRFTSYVVRGRWFMVFASMLIMSAAGATYIFGIYSKDIKSSLGYDQQTLNTLGFFKDLGANIGVISGLIAEVTPPWVVLAIGAGMNLFGYLMIYLAITGRTAKPRFWQMCLYICIGADSQSFANTGSLVTCVKREQGGRPGVAQGFSSGLPAAISILFIPTIRIMKPIPGSGKSELKVFYYFLYVSLVLAGYLMVAIIVHNSVTLPRQAYDASAAVILIILFLPLIIVFRVELKSWLRNQELHGLTIEKQSTPAAPQPLPRVVEVFRGPGRGEDFSILQALVSLDMMILFIATICGIGGTLTAIDNMGQIGESLGYPQRTIGTFVSLISIWNYLGRVVAGFCSEIFLTRYRFPRTLVLTLVLLLSCVGHLLIAFGLPGSLYVASVIIGFCFGAQWPLVFAIISELFGLKYYSTLYNFGAVASPVGSYLLNVKVAGQLYDREAEKQRAAGLATAVAAKAGGKDLTCIGVKCFRLSFLIVTAVTLFGVLVSLMLVLRTREFYKSDIYAKFREGAAANGEETQMVPVAENSAGGATTTTDGERRIKNESSEQTRETR